MTQSSSLRFFSSFRTGKNETKQVSVESDTSSSQQPDNVKGWLMNVETYREPNVGMVTSSTIVDADNNSIPIGNIRNSRDGRPGSIASEDSVNLEELINANYTVDMDDETDLPDLADLDLDDSTDDFWKLDKSESLVNSDATLDDFSASVANNYELDWSPSDTTTPKSLKSSLPVTPLSDFGRRYNRSDSVSSENSLTSQSTITQYAKYGLTPVTYPSESSSTSSRPLSRQSNYSTASSTTTSGIPHPRTNSSNNSNVGIPTPSRSYTLRDNNASHLLSPSNKKGSTQRGGLKKRASHIPAPASFIPSPPSPQRTISSSSSGLPTQKRIPQRSSHIPSARESIHRPTSPMQQRPSATPSRIGMRSPTPGGPRNSLFSPKEPRSVTPTRFEEKRGTTPTSRPSGLRPPGSVASSVRSVSRIGTYKKS